MKLQDVEAFQTEKLGNTTMRLFLANKMEQKDDRSNASHNVIQVGLPCRRTFDYLFYLDAS